MSKLQDKEAKVLKNFRAVTEDLNQDDCTLLRFLRARNFDIKKAEIQLRKSLKWRKEYDVDSVKSWDPPSILKKEMRREFTGFDDSGIPVYMIKLGQIDIRPLLAQGYKDDLKRFELKSLEMGLMRAKLLHGTYQFAAVVDFAGLTFGKAAHWASLQLLLDILKDFEANFPEVLSRCVVINCPAVFWYSYNIVKYIFSAHTLSKIIIFNTDETKWKEGLLQHIPLHCLTKEYGGTAIGVSAIE